MQIAVISDIHGNWNALENVLGEIRRLGVDKIICLGDMVNPLPHSRKVFEYVMSESIPTLRGNHEDYIINGFEKPSHDINHLHQFLPIRHMLKNFTSAHIQKMKSLPLTLRLENKEAGDVLFCHASPGANNKGWKFGISPELNTELLAQKASSIVCGHWHDPQTTPWEHGTLVTAGSVGIPLAGKHESEYLLMESKKGSWSFEHRTIAFDASQTVSEFLNSAAFIYGGPMAWLLLCELKSAQRHVSHYFPWLKQNGLKPDTQDQWARAVREFLEAKGSWGYVGEHVS